MSKSDRTFITSRHCDMAAFDRLPKKVRIALSNAPFGYSAQGVSRLLRRGHKSKAIIEHIHIQSGADIRRLAYANYAPSHPQAGGRRKMQPLQNRQ